LFFKNKEFRFLSSLIYTFNPLFYSFRGQGMVYAAIPLFVYSFYKFYTKEKGWAKFLILNVFASFLWSGNVRFIQANLFLVIPYVVYLFYSQKLHLSIKKISVFFIFYFFVFLPMIFSFLIQFFQKTPGIFYFGTVFNNFVVKGRFLDIFNLFQSSNVILYNSKFFLFSGIMFFIVIMFLLLKSLQKKSLWVFLNLALFVLGISFFKMGFIFGPFAYSLLIKIVPFLTNAPFYGLYIASIPLIFLIFEIAKVNKKAVYVGSLVYIVLALIPLLDLNDFKLQKFQIDKIPVSYVKDFIDPYRGIPEATDYFPYSCWRAAYMQKNNTPTQCFNIGMKYKPISSDDPRGNSGTGYYLSKKLYENPNIDNLRVTHNLKNLVLANDIVEEKDAGPLYGTEDIKVLEQLKVFFNRNKNLSVVKNENFYRYFFKDKDRYDFLVYSPAEIILRDKVNSIFDNSLILSKKPVVLQKSTISKDIQGKVKISYKISQFDRTRYYLKIENVKRDKPFLIHLAQTFKPGWELVLINKKEFDKIECGNFRTFSITNNSSCQFNASLIDLNSVLFLQKQKLGEHLLGNYVGNTWVIEPKELGNNIGRGEFYAVIFYKNQVYFILTILISCISLLLLIVYTLIQEGKRK